MMTFEELNEEVLAEVSGPNWFKWRGAYYDEGSGFATDKTIFVKEEFSDPDIYEFMETLETPESERHSGEDAADEWWNMVSDYGVYEITPLALFDLSDDDNFLFDHLILFKNRDRDTNIIVDAERYRILLDAVPIEAMRGKERSDPLVTLAYEEKDNEEVEYATGILAPFTDQSGSYTEKFRELRPDLRV